MIKIIKLHDIKPRRDDPRVLQIIREWLDELDPDDIADIKLSVVKG